MRLSNRVFWLVLMSLLTLSMVGFGEETLPRISATEATNYINQRVVVVDKVVQVAFRSNIWLLHLNQKFPNSPLNVTIRKGFTNYFPNAGDYAGQEVEITGEIVTNRDRLELALTSPSQIKVLDPGQSVFAPLSSRIIAPGKAAQPTATTPQAAAGQLATAPVTTRSNASHDAGSNRAIGWILGLLTAMVALLAIGACILWQRPDDTPVSARPAQAMPVVLAADARAAVPVANASSLEDWRQRALAAEAMAGQQGQLLREQMLPELKEFAKQSLVQGLYEQRNALIETQRQAQQALAELESRLGAIQAPLQERIRVYESRIAELERAVDTQNEEMRELTRATLALVRQKLAVERESGALLSRFN